LCGFLPENPAEEDVLRSPEILGLQRLADGLSVFWWFF